MSTSTTLARPVGLLLLFWLGLGLLPAAAVHLLGGEMTYRYLDATGPAAKPWRYELTMRFYYNPATDLGEQEALITIFKSGQHYGTPLDKRTLTRTSNADISLPPVPGCGPPAPPMGIGLYVDTVSLPVTPEGFWATCVTSNRTAGITNLDRSALSQMVLMVDMAPATIPNASPVFAAPPLALICAGTSSFVANTAYDADGDELEYVLSAPINNNTPYLPNQVTLVTYAPGYSSTQPFGAGGQLSVNAGTGFSTYLCPTQGIFQLAVDVLEYRTISGQRKLLGKVHRDMQVVVRACAGPPGLPPAFTAATLAQRDFQLSEGQVLAFTAAATDPDGHALTLTARSALLDGPGGIASSLDNQLGSVLPGSPGGSASVRSVGTVAGTFRLSGCGSGRRAPYEVLLTATDEVCNSQTVAAIFHVTVVRPAFVGSVRGPAGACTQSTGVYSVAGADYPAYQWNVVGGQVLGPATGPTVQVLWGSAAAGVVRASGLTALGCPTEPAELAVALRPGLQVVGPAGYCLNAATGLRYGVAGPVGPYQWSITDGVIVGGQGTGMVEVDVVPGATATLQVANPALSTCVGTLLIKPDSRCLYFYNVITPNGDGQNETFTIRNVEQHPQTALTVFNRWGQQVFHSDDYRNTFGGEGTNAGLYYYLCKTNEGAVYKGWFEVIR